MNDIPNDLTKFIHANLTSVDQLRVLLLLFRSPAKEWEVMEVSSALYLQPDIAIAALAQLQACGLIVAGSSSRSYRYQPDTKKNAEFVQRVAQVDRERPVSLINLIYARPPDQAQAFADAFKLTKKEEEEKQ